MLSEKNRNPRKLRSEHDCALRAFLARKFHEHHLSKAQISDRLTEILGEPVSLSRLESFTASTKISARLPGYFLRALCEVLDSDDILLFLARPRLQKQIELAESVRELRRICDELLAELPAKHSGRSPSPKSKIPGDGVPAEKRNGNGSCAR